MSKAWNKGLGEKKLGPLSPHQKRVLRLVLEGHTNDEILALIPGTSERMIRYHLGRIYWKLDIEGNRPGENTKNYRRIRLLARFVTIPSDL